MDKQELKDMDKKLIKGIEIANSFKWGLSNFKRFVSQFLKTGNDEDDWTFDYESYCLQLTGIYPERLHRYVHPSNWAADYYQDRWDSDKMNKSIESLGRIARGEEVINSNKV